MGHLKPSIKAKHPHPSLCRDLTAREDEIVDLIAEGAGNREIADSLFITVDTVKKHMTNIFDKTGMGTRLELAVQRLTQRHEAELAQIRAARVTETLYGQFAETHNSR